MTNRQSFNSWITCPKPNPQADLRLFYFHYAGGSTSVFRSWAGTLPETIEVCPVELPGRGSHIKTPLFTQLEPLVQAMAPYITPFLNKRFAFFGHSMGALIAFELTRLIRSEYHLSPLHLFVSARRAPQIPPRKPPIYNLPDPELIEEIRLFNGTPSAVLDNPELMDLFLPILRADFSIVDTYVYSPDLPLECPITAFGGLQDETVNDTDLAGWQKQTISSFSVKMLDGDHFFLQSSQEFLLMNITQQLHW